MKRFILFLSLLVVSLSSTVIPAYAASDFDDVVVQGQPFIECYKTTTGGYNTEKFDLRYTYLTLIQDSPDSSNKTTFLNAYDNALNEGQGWSLVQDIYNDGTRDISTGVTLWVTTNPTVATASFYDNGFEKTLQMHNAIRATVYCENDGQYKVSFNVSSTNRVIASNNLSNPNNTRPVFANVNISYPSGYSGTVIPDTIPNPDNQTQLTPDFSYSVNADGDLKVTYLKNISPFLTGVFYWKIDDAGNNWNGPITNKTVVTVQPAGLMDETYRLDAPGYYRFDMSHNQQLDSPPWPADTTNYFVKQVWVEIYWDGHTPINGTTVGCGGQIICNQLTNPDNLPDQQSKTVVFDLGGIGSMITIPVEVLQAILDAPGCSPITIPLMGTTVTWPCLSTTFYNQAWFQPLWIVWQLVLTGGVIWLVANQSLRLIQGLADPNKDRIEVTQL